MSLKSASVWEFRVDEKQLVVQGRVTGKLSWCTSWCQCGISTDRNIVTENMQKFFLSLPRSAVSAMQSALIDAKRSGLGGRCLFQDADVQLMVTAVS